MYRSEPTGPVPGRMREDPNIGHFRNALGVATVLAIPFIGKMPAVSAECRVPSASRYLVPLARPLARSC